ARLAGIPIELGSPYINVAKSLPEVKDDATHQSRDDSNVDKLGKSRSIIASLEESTPKGKMLQLVVVRNRRVKGESKML
ncbi:hypothetical protein Tco_0739184, partial [Tanacetum coccineum]